MILLVGATGGMGSRVAFRLLERGEDVRILLRQDPNTISGHPTGRDLVAAGARPVVGDLKDPTSLRTAVAGVEAVFTTANAFVPSGERGENNLDTVDRQGNRDLIIAAREAGVRQFVFASAYAASPDSSLPFEQAKAETEAFLRASRVPFTILAPTVILEDIFGLVIGHAVAAGEPVHLVDGGRRKGSFVSLEDAAALGAAVVFGRDALGAYIPIGGPVPVSWRDLVEMAAGILERPIPIRAIWPGEKDPSVSPLLVELLTMMETRDYLVEGMPGIARRFGVELTPIEITLQKILAELDLGGKE